MKSKERIEYEERFRSLWEGKGHSSYNEWKEQLVKDLIEDRDKLRAFANEWSDCDGDGLD